MEWVIPSKTPAPCVASQSNQPSISLATGVKTCFSIGNRVISSQGFDTVNR